MKRLIAYALLFTVLLSATAQTSSEKITEKNIEHLLKEKSAQTETISCHFRQTKKMSVLAKPVISEGTFYYKKENKICMAYSDPAGDMLLMNDDKFLIVTNGKKNIADAGRNPGLKALRQMLAACMSGNVQDLVLGGKNTITYDLNNGLYVITIGLDKKKTRGTIKSIVLSFDPSDLSLSELLMEEFSGDYTRYEFSDKKFNVGIDDNLFNIR